MNIVKILGKYYQEIHTASNKQYNIERVV